MKLKKLTYVFDVCFTVKSEFQPEEVETGELIAALEDRIVKLKGEEESMAREAFSLVDSCEEE